MEKHVSVELRCSKTSDGKYTAHTYINGKQLKEREFTVNRSNEFAIVLLYQRVVKKYPKDPITVKGLDKHAMDEIKRVAG